MSKQKTNKKEFLKQDVKEMKARGYRYSYTQKSWIKPEEDAKQSPVQSNSKSHSELFCPTDDELANHTPSPHPAALLTLEEKTAILKGKIIEKHKNGDRDYIVPGRILHQWGKHFEGWSHEDTVKILTKLQDTGIVAPRYKERPQIPSWVFGPALTGKTQEAPVDLKLLTNTQEEDVILQHYQRKVQEGMRPLDFITHITKICARSSLSILLFCIFVFSGCSGSRVYSQSRPTSQSNPVATATKQNMSFAVTTRHKQTKLYKHAIQYGLNPIEAALLTARVDFFFRNDYKACVLALYAMTRLKFIPNRLVLMCRSMGLDNAIPLSHLIMLLQSVSCQKHNANLFLNSLKKLFGITAYRDAMALWSFTTAPQQCTLFREI